MDKGRAHQGAVEDPAQASVVLMCPAGAGWALVIVDDSFPPEDVWEAWDVILSEAWDKGFRSEVLLEEPDVIHQDRALYFLF